jgi:hypothetical protein
MAHLKQEGWTRQFVASEPRLSEAAAMYREIGFEVRLEPLSPQGGCRSCTDQEDPDACRACFEGSEDQYKIIFTRPLKDASRQGDGND